MEINALVAVASPSNREPQPLSDYIPVLSSSPYRPLLGLSLSSAVKGEEAIVGFSSRRRRRLCCFFVVVLAQEEVEQKNEYNHRDYYRPTAAGWSWWQPTCNEDDDKSRYKTLVRNVLHAD